MNRVGANRPAPPSKYVDLTVSTWEKDSHGLYDYELPTNRTHQRKFKIEGPCKIFRNWLSTRSIKVAADTVVFSNDDIKRGRMPSEELHFMASISINRNGNTESSSKANIDFVLNTPEQPSMPIVRTDPNLPPEEQGPVNTNSYLVTKYLEFGSGSSKVNGHPLEPGDTIKLGRMEFLVIECRNREQTYTIRSTNHLGEKNGVHTVEEEFSGSCKICLSDEATPDNFLFSPCKCKGSCELVHLNCLKMWIDSKVKKQVNGIASTYNFTKFECELCKEPFPKAVRHHGKHIEMISIEKPSRPYIIFESLNERNETREEKNLHLICADEKQPIKLGRGHQCEIRMTDISVSRVHAQIRFEQNRFIITDQNSKFGTLVKLDRKTDLTKDLILQAGRSTFAFTLQSDR